MLTHLEALNVSFPMAIMGWGANKVNTKAGSLTGAQPRKMVDNIAKYYLWAPMLSGV